MDITSYDLELKTVLSGGESLSPETLRYFESHGIPVLEGYGQTNGSPLICNCEAFFDVKAGSIGKPVPDTKSNSLRSGQTKRASGKSPFGRPDPVKFKRYIGRDESDGDYYEDDWYLTGDLARVDDDGYF